MFRSASFRLARVFNALAALKYITIVKLIIEQFKTIFKYES